MSKAQGDSFAGGADRRASGHKLCNHLITIMMRGKKTFLLFRVSKYVRFSVSSHPTCIRENRFSPHALRSRDHFLTRRQTNRPPSSKILNQLLLLFPYLQNHLILLEGLLVSTMPWKSTFKKQWEKFRRNHSTATLSPAPMIPSTGKVL